ncbi:unnamed protein product, partial [Rotaria sordida]
MLYPKTDDDNNQQTTEIPNSSNGRKCI